MIEIRVDRWKAEAEKRYGENSLAPEETTG